MLKYKCKRCGEPLGFDGICWRCRVEENRQKVLCLSENDINRLIDKIVENIEELPEWGEDYDNFMDLFCYRGVVPFKIQEAALEKQIYFPAQIYYKSSSEVRDKLIRRLYDAEGSIKGAELMSCLAMQGDDVSLDALYRLEQNPPSWRSQLYVNPSIYAQDGGWTFNKDKKRTKLVYDTCYVMEKGESKTNSPVKIGEVTQKRCEHCGCNMVDMLTIDGRDNSMSFLNVDGIIKATCCPNCISMSEGVFLKYSLDGKSEILDFDPFNIENNMSEEEVKAICDNTFVLSEKPVPLFYGANAEDLNTIGGFANWVQDWEYRECPQCKKSMRYLAQIQWSTIDDFMEGTLYFEICTDCKTIAIFHQQT